MYFSITYVTLQYICWRNPYMECDLYSIASWWCLYLLRGLYDYYLSGFNMTLIRPALWISACQGLPSEWWWEVGWPGYWACRCWLFGGLYLLTRHIILVVWGGVDDAFAWHIFNVYLFACLKIVIRKFAHWSVEQPLGNRKLIDRFPYWMHVYLELVYPFVNVQI